SGQALRVLRASGADPDRAPPRPLATDGEDPDRGPRDRPAPPTSESPGQPHPPHGQGVRPALAARAPWGRSALADPDRGARVGSELRQRHERRGGAGPSPPIEDRRSLRDEADPHGARARLRPRGALIPDSRNAMPMYPVRNARIVAM